MPKPIEEILKGLSGSQNAEMGKMLVDFTGMAMQSLISMHANNAAAASEAEEIGDIAVSIALATTFALIKHMED